MDFGNIDKKDALIAVAVVVGAGLLVLLVKHQSATTATTGVGSSSGANALVGGYSTAPTVYVPTSSYDINYETNNGTIIHSTTSGQPSTTYVAPSTGLVSTPSNNTPTSTQTSSTSTTATSTNVAPAPTPVASSSVMTSQQWQAANPGVQPTSLGAGTYVNPAVSYGSVQGVNPQHVATSTTGVSYDAYSNATPANAPSQFTGKLNGQAATYKQNSDGSYTIVGGGIANGMKLSYSQVMANL